MKIHWPQERDIFKQIVVYWYKGGNKNAEYFTEPFTKIIHHQQ